MRKPCKTKRCSNLAVVGGAYCLSCRRRRRRLRSSRSVCRDWSIYALPDHAAPSWTLPSATEPDSLQVGKDRSERIHPSEETSIAATLYIDAEF